VVVVARDHLHPFARQPFNRHVREHVGVGHLAPDQQAQAIAPVEEAGIGNHLVNAHPVETHFFDQLYLVAKRIRIRSSQVRIWPVALLKHESQEIRKAVQQESSISNVYGTYPDITLHFIDDFVTGKERKRHIDEVRIARRP